MMSENLRENLIRLAVLVQGTVGIAFKELESGETLFVNEQEVFPSASLAKIPIAVGIGSLAAGGTIDISGLVNVEPNTPAIVKQREQDGSGVLPFLRIKHTLTIEELCTLMIIVSDNVAANILLNITGLDAINQVLTDLGFSVTRVTNFFEDFDELEDVTKNPTTPYEMMHLLDLLHNNKIPFSQTMVQILKQQQFNSRLPLFLPRGMGIEVAHKTGSLEHAFHDVGIIYSPVGNYVLCVLTKKISSRATADLLIAEISRLIYETLSHDRK